MIIFRNHNNFGDCLLQLGLLKMLHEQHKVEVGFIVADELQYEAIRTANFLNYYIQAGFWKDCEEIIIEGNQTIDFQADESARGKMSLIEMWAQSIPYKLEGEKKPFIQLTDGDYKQAHKLKLNGKTFVAPFIRACDFEKEVFAGQDWLQNNFANKGCYLLGAKEDAKWQGFECLMGLPIQVVGVLLQEAGELYCISNGIAILAWAVGCPRIYEWITPLRSWAKISYSRRIN